MSHADEIVKIVIPSAQRAETVLSTKAVDHAILCVPASEEAAYKEHCPETELLTHPDELHGIAPKRQWILDHFDGNVFQLDDDIPAFTRVYQRPPAQNVFLEPAVAYDQIQRTAELCKDMGLYLFGFAKGSDVRDFVPQKPFRLKGVVLGCAMGILRGSKIKFVLPGFEGLRVCEDFIASGLNAYHHRMALVDLRFAAHALETNRREGGLSMHRTSRSEEEGTAALKTLFGEAIQQSIQRREGQVREQRVRPAHARRLVVPF